MEAVRIHVNLSVVPNSKRQRSSVYLNACEDLLRAYAWLPVALFIQDADRGGGGGAGLGEMTVGPVEG
jgi:hypothetical protein